MGHLDHCLPNKNKWFLSIGLGTLFCFTKKKKRVTLFFIIVAEVFKLHMEELRAKQEEISKKDSEIKLLEAIIQTLGGKESTSVRY